MERKAQFTLEDLYISPFTAQRQYDKEGNVEWIPLDRNIEPSGVWVMDHYLQFLMRGGYYRPQICQQEGVTSVQLSSLVAILTGMSIIVFQQRYVLMVADKLLRYTSMPARDIARNFGGIDGTNLYRLYKKYYNTTPSLRRIQLRQPGDEDRYKV